MVVSTSIKLGHLQGAFGFQPKLVALVQIHSVVWLKNECKV